MKTPFAREARNRPLKPARSVRVRSIAAFSQCLCVLAANFLLLPAALAQDASVGPFSDLRDGGKRHTASGFVCPAMIGAFERDAVGEAAPASGADFCADRRSTASTARSGSRRWRVPTTPPRRWRLASSSRRVCTARRIADGLATLAIKPLPVSIYARTDETARLEDLHYRVVFAGAQFRNCDRGDRRICRSARHARRRPVPARRLCRCGSRARRQVASRAGALLE